MTPDNICAYGGLVSPQFKIKWLIKIHFTDAGDAEADVLFGIKTQRHLGIPHLCFDLKKKLSENIDACGYFLKPFIMMWLFMQSRGVDRNKNKKLVFLNLASGFAKVIFCCRIKILALKVTKYNSGQYTQKIAFSTS